jgi:hypothetical protein
MIGCVCVVWETVRYQAPTSFGFQLGDNLFVLCGIMTGLVLLLTRPNPPEPAQSMTWRWRVVIGIFGVGICTGIIMVFFYRPQPIIWQTALLLGVCCLVCFDAEPTSKLWQRPNIQPYRVWGVMLTLWVLGMALRPFLSQPAILVGLAAVIGIMLPGLSIYLGLNPDAHLLEALLWSIPVGISLYLVVMFWLERLVIPVRVTTFDLISISGIALGVLFWQIGQSRSRPLPSKSASGDESP